MSVEAGSPPEAGARCRVCGGREADLLAVVDRPPAGEKDYGVPPGEYRRSLWRCRGCQVYLNRQEIVPHAFYTGGYNQAIYAGRLLEAFRRVRALPEGESDNRARVRRVAAFLAAVRGGVAGARVLDVGSGLCVFLAELKEQGCEGHCVDPDPAAVRHALEHAGVDGAHAGTLDTYEPAGRFDLVTFNKVLEHVAEPVRLLRQARALLAPGGAVYVELPDADLAQRFGALTERQELFAEHYTAWNRPSVERLAREAGCAPVALESLREPSGKCTIYAFLKPEAAP